MIIIEICSFIGYGFMLVVLYFFVEAIAKEVFAANKEFLKTLVDKVEGLYWKAITSTEKR